MLAGELVADAQRDAVAAVALQPRDVHAGGARRPPPCRRCCRRRPRACRRPARTRRAGSSRATSAIASRLVERGDHHDDRREAQAGVALARSAGAPRRAPRRVRRQCLGAPPLAELAIVDASCPAPGGGQSRTARASGAARVIRASTWPTTGTPRAPAAAAAALRRPPRAAAAAPVAAAGPRLPRAGRAVAARAEPADLRPVGVADLGPRDRPTGTSTRSPARRGSRCRSLFTDAVRAGRRRRRAVAVARRRARRRAAGDRDGLPAGRPPRPARAAGVARGRRCSLAEPFVSASRPRQLGGPARRARAVGDRAPPRRAAARRLPARRRGGAAAPGGLAVRSPLYGLWLLRRAPRRPRRGRTVRARRRRRRPSSPLLWFVPEYIGSGDVFRARPRARCEPVPDSPAQAAHPFVAVFTNSAAALSSPSTSARVLAVLLAAARRLARGRAAADRARARGRSTVLMVIVAVLAEIGLHRQPALRHPAGRAGLRAGGRRLGAGVRARPAAPRARSWRPSRRSSCWLPRCPSRSPTCTGRGLRTARDDGRAVRRPPGGHREGRRPARGRSAAAASSPGRSRCSSSPGTCTCPAGDRLPAASRRPPSSPSAGAAARRARRGSGRWR